MSGKLISLKEATERKEAYRKLPLAADQIYVESEFYSVDILKKLVGDVPIKDVAGLRVSFAQVGREGKSVLTTVLELVLKEEVKTETIQEAAGDPPACPIFCS